MRLDVTGFVTFIGVDLHKCTVTLRAVRADGELLGQLKCDTQCIERIAESIKSPPGPKWLAVEACPFVEWFIERFTPCVDRMDIADATELSMRRGKRRKDDRYDALDIAPRLAEGERIFLLPGVDLGAPVGEAGRGLFHDLVEVHERILHVGDDRDVHDLVLVDLGGIDVDVDDESVVGGQTDAPQK